MTVSRLGEIMLKRSTATAPATAVDPVEVLVDLDRYAELRPAWEAAQRAAGQARAKALLAAEKGRRKMNGPSLADEADAEAEAAEARADELKAQVRECFVRVVVRGLTGPEYAEIEAKHPKPEDRRKAQLMQAIVKVTDHEDNDLDDITPAIFADFLRNASLGDEARVWKAITEASAGVDFPT